MIALAVRRASGPRATSTRSTTPSTYLRNSHARRLLPMPACPVIETRRTRRSRAVAWNRSLSSRSSASRPTNGASSRSSRPRPRRSATTRSARQTRHRRDLALEHLLAGLLVGDRAARSPGGSTRRRGRLPGGATDWSREAVLTRSPATIPWSLRADRHRGLAGEDAGARLDPGSERSDRVDELEARADRALGVVLVGGRRAPDRHHRVADELLHRAAVAVDRSPTRARSSATAARARPPGRAPRRAW